MRSRIPPGRRVRSMVCEVLGLRGIPPQGHRMGAAEQFCSTAGSFDACSGTILFHQRAIRWLWWNNLRSPPFVFRLLVFIPTEWMVRLESGTKGKCRRLDGYASVSTGCIILCARTVSSHIIQGKCRRLDGYYPLFVAEQCCSGRRASDDCDGTILFHERVIG